MESTLIATCLEFQKQFSFCIDRRFVRVDSKVMPRQYHQQRMLRRKPSTNTYTTLHRLGLVLTLSALLANQVGACYSFPEINRRAMAGLWKLSKQVQQYPMKEFTVYPKQPSAESIMKAAEEYLLMLKEDGSFRQYSDGDEEEQNRERIVKRVIAKRTKEDTVMGLGFQTGTWDFVDGKLLLAAERPGGETNDTLLVGKVIATSQSSLFENPVAHDKENTTVSTSSGARDTHLSVPKGSVKIGKFFYPRQHPLFFEQPMFNPLSGDRFQLNQVLGTLNTAIERDAMIEKFRREDFANKTFLLTSHPIPTYKPKGNLRWSIRYNKFVEDPIINSVNIGKDNENGNDDSGPILIRVMEVQLFANQTFCTTAGLGSAAILRGKWDITGDTRDTFWMQVWRFGFGRSVSGSTFSEGTSLTQEDAKTYWGEIGYIQNVNNDDNDDGASSKIVTESAKSNRGASSSRLQVTGSVILGSGLEPQPVARFIMREKEEDEDYEYEDDDDDEEEEELEGARLMEMLDSSADGKSTDMDDTDTDWSESFQ